MEEQQRLTRTVGGFAERQREEEMKRKKEKLPPKPPKEKPVIFDITQNSLKLSWQPSEIPPYGEQTPIFYIVERRSVPRRQHHLPSLAFTVLFPIGVRTDCMVPGRCSDGSSSA